MERELASLQLTLTGVDKNVAKLQKHVEQLRPVYTEAKMALGSASSQQQKNNLVFHGIEPDPLEVSHSHLCSCMLLYALACSGIVLHFCVSLGGCGAGRLRAGG